MVMTPFQTYTTVRYAEKLNRIEMAEATALISIAYTVMRRASGLLTPRL
jgi:hypothetical protein